MKISEMNNNIVVENIDCLSLDLTLDCGQSFRWEKNSNVWNTVAFGRFIEVEQIGNSLTFFNMNQRDFETIWAPYFDLNRNYAEICKTISADSNIAKAVTEYPGIRILNQDSWETLCSFIISQNNNIPRIKGIIDRLCENFGDNLGDGHYTFPSAECITKLSEADLAPLRAGFRNKYILDAARKVSDGTVNLGSLRGLPLDAAEAELLKIKGVGPKVAQCVLLYGCGQVDAFPIDVWVKRILGEMYPEGLPVCTNGLRGIAQQYLFHWRRNSPLFE